MWHFCVTYVEGFLHQLCHMTGFQLFVEWMHTIPEHLVSLHLGSSWLPHIIYTVHNLSMDCDYGWMTLVCLPGSVWLICLGLIFITEKQRLIWLMSMTEVNLVMQELTINKLQQWAEQWAEKAIQLRDTNDTDTILSTLNDKNPFEDHPVMMNTLWLG